MAQSKEDSKKVSTVAVGEAKPALSVLDPKLIGGLKKRVRQIVVEGIGPDGDDAIVHHLPFTAGQMMQFQQDIANANEAEAKGENPRHIERVIKILSRSLTSPTGETVFTEEVLKEVPADLLVLIMTTMAKTTTAPLGKAALTERTEGSPTG